MANSRLGSPAEGGTHKLNADLYRAIFEKKLKTLGQAYTYTKTNNAANAKTNNELSYCFYEMNMFGDPTMLLWTAKPKILSVTATDPFSETSGVRVKVTDGGSAVDSALVCLMWKDDSVIETVGYTGSDGVIDLDITHKSGYDSLWLTITKQNYLPVEKCLYYDETTSSLSHLTSNKGYVWQIHSKRQFDVISSNKVSSHARRIGVRIFDMTGRVIHQSKHILNAGERTITFDRKKAVRAAGACIIEIRAKNETVAMRHFM